MSSTMNDRSKQKSPTRRRTLTFTIIVTALAVGALFSLPREDLYREPFTLLLILALSALTGYRPINIRPLRTTISASDPFLFATIAALGGLPAVLVGLISILTTMIGAKLRPSLLKLLFNIAAAVTSIAAAAWAFELLATGERTVARQVFPLLAATTVYFVVNTSLISAVISIDGGKSFFATWKKTSLWTAVTSYCATTLAVALLFLLDAAGPIWLVLGIPPLWLFIAYFRSHRDRLREQQMRMEQILESNQRLEEQVQARTEQLAAKVAELERAKDHLRELANTDELTMLSNRRRFDHTLEREFNRSSRFDHPLSILLLDIDHFKSINDTYGHPVGDLVLQQLANAIDKSVRNTDLTARYGGEEFALVLAETPKFGAMTMAKQLRTRIAEHRFGTPDGNDPIRVTVSIGVASFPEDAETVEELISIADQRLYKAKQAGRDRVVA